MLRRKYNLIQKNTQVEMEDDKFYTFNTSGDLVEQTVEMVTDDDLLFISDKGDLRNDELIERNISVLNEKKANADLSNVTLTDEIKEQLKGDIGPQGPQGNPGVTFSFSNGILRITTN
jgi:hypothetical protein